MFWKGKNLSEISWLKQNLKPSSYPYSVEYSNKYSTYEFETKTEIKKVLTDDFDSINKLIFATVFGH